MDAVAIVGFERAASFGVQAGSWPTAHGNHEGCDLSAARRGMRNAPSRFAGHRTRSGRRTKNKAKFGATTVARFVQVEDQLLLIINLQIDSSLPIVGQTDVNVANKVKDERE